MGLLFVFFFFFLSVYAEFYNGRAPNIGVEYLILGGQQKLILISSL